MSAPDALARIAESLERLTRLVESREVRRAVRSLSALVVRLEAEDAAGQKRPRPTKSPRIVR